MVIYDIHNSKILDATLTEGAEHEQELGRSDLVRLSWQSDVKVTLPAGAYIIPFDDGLKYRLLSPYTPTEDDRAFKYTPEFHHPLMWLSRVPFLYDTTDAEKNPIKQQEWSFEGLTTNALEYACKAINEALGITEKAQQFTYTLCGNVDSSVSFSVSSNDILSVLSSIAQGCKNNACEWHLSWKHKALYFGQISINLGEDVPTLKVHENIQKASVSESKEPYYNRFYPQGSTKNMSTKALVGTGNVATLLRLGLDKSVYPDGYIYVDTEGNVITKDAFEASGEIKQTLALSFDDVYPHIDLYVYNVRKHIRYLKNSQTNTIELDSRGNKKTYTIWYMRLAFPSTTQIEGKAIINTTYDKDEGGNIITHYWYDYEIDQTKQVLQGYTLKGIFKVNTHAVDGHYDVLTQGLVGQPNGQEGFELHYHEINNPIAPKPNEGDSGVNILKGDYEILKYQSGDTIIPTNESEGLYPRGKNLPDFTCNIVVLFNIVMGEHETKLAQAELASRTIKEIKRRAQDNNNYSFASNPRAFVDHNPNLYLGQKVVFDDGQGYKLKTRVIKLVTKLDYPIIQEITVGNQAVKGTISQLKEDVNNILSGNFSGGGLNSTQISELIKNYVDPRFLRKNAPDTAQELITFLKGIAVGNGYGITELGDLFARFIKANSVKSDDFRSGLLDGAGFGIYKDEYGKSIAEVDKLNVRQKATFSELEYKRLAFTTGDVGFTSASAHIYSVIPVGANGAPIVNSTTFFKSANKQVMINNALLSYSVSAGGNSISAYRCYFLADDGDKRISNDWRIGDQAMCKTSNLISRTSNRTANRYYWRLVVNKGTETINGKLYHFVDLSDVRGTLDLTIDGKQYTCVGYATNIEINNDIPKAEDDIIQLGSQTDTDRQYAHIIYVSEGKRVDYAGINNYDLASHIINEFSPKEITVRSDRFKIISAAGTGVSSSLVCDRGEWVSGTTAGHYDRFSYNGSLWLCNVGIGNTTNEAPTESSRIWIKQVSQSDVYSLEVTIESGAIYDSQGSVVLLATYRKGNVDISGTITSTLWSWIRISGQSTDAEWNTSHKGVGRRITVLASEVDSMASFDCIIEG
nr:MAG TPA: tail protein [Caudoviricetes sp.]